MICTLIRLDTGLPFIVNAMLVENADGSVSFQLASGLFAGQSPWLVGEPSTYGVQHPPSSECGAYQRASRDGASVTFLTRPQDNPCGYALFVGKAF